MRELNKDGVHHSRVHSTRAVDAVMFSMLNGSSLDSRAVA